MATANELLAIARKQIGVCENPPNSNNVRYNTWYYGREVMGSAYPWCMVFVQWVFAQAGVKLPMRTASCGQLMNAAKAAGCWVTTSFLLGDVVIYDFPGGAANAIPTGWALCNGQNNTPDLRNRFIVGAGSTYAVGATGGSNTVTLTVAQMPSHNHELNLQTSAGTTKTGLGIVSYGDVHIASGTTVLAGGGQSHENRPPYYALCFIMKT